MKFFRTEPKTGQGQLTRQEALRCTPVVNSSITFSELESGEVLIEYPLPLQPFFLSVFRRFQKTQEVPTRKLQLDEMGSIVWQKIDGSTSVGNIIGAFAQEYGITLGEAEKSVTAFLAQLGKRGIIAMR